LAQEISIQFTRFSAFYSPLIATIAGGYLEEEGLTPKHSVAPAGKSAIAGLVDGSVHVAQSAVSQAFGPLEKGAQPPALHFAQINEMDGFFLVGRKPEPDFKWANLKGRAVVFDHGEQPSVMFRYACHKSGVDIASLKAVNAGTTEQMIEAFKKGTGDYVHLQGPGPQQLEHDKVGHIVASVGKPIGPCAFSSLAATREFLKTDMAKKFMRAYRKGRAWLLKTPAAEVAKKEASFFSRIDPAVLATTIAAYQKLGNWTPHVEITRAAYEATLDIFQHAGKITRRHQYEDAIAQPPG
jgi:NitT/TauT family transport system substrate-binding protein